MKQNKFVEAFERLGSFRIIEEYVKEIILFNLIKNLILEFLAFEEQ
jgi:hypothetical protein